MIMRQKTVFGPPTIRNYTCQKTEFVRQFSFRSIMCTWYHAMYYYTGLRGFEVAHLRKHAIWFLRYCTCSQ